MVFEFAEDIDEPPRMFANGDRFDEEHREAAHFGLKGIAEAVAGVQPRGDTLRDRPQRGRAGLGLLLEHPHRRKADAEPVLECPAPGHQRPSRADGTDNHRALGISRILFVVVVYHDLEYQPGATMQSDAEALANFSGTVRLFPLPNLVLFPHVVQGLHIFEPR